MVLFNRKSPLLVSKEGSTGDPSRISDPRVISSNLVRQYQFITAFSTLGVDQIAYGERYVLVSEFHLMRTAGPAMCSTEWAIWSRWFRFHCRMGVKPNKTEADCTDLRPGSSVVFPANLTRFGAGTDRRIRVSATTSTSCARSSRTCSASSRAPPTAQDKAARVWASPPTSPNVRRNKPVSLQFPLDKRILPTILLPTVLLGSDRC